MYQLVVLGLGISLVVGGGFYIARTDNAGVLGKAISDNPSAVHLTAEDLAGTYACDTKSGCVDPYSLSLSEDGTAQMEVVHENQIETTTEHGAWSLEQGGMISLVLTGTATTTYEIPHQLLIQSVSTSTLSRYSYDRKFYADMSKPVFIRHIEAAAE